MLMGVVDHPQSWSLFMAARVYHIGGKEINQQSPKVDVQPPAGTWCARAAVLGDVSNKLQELHGAKTGAGCAVEKRRRTGTAMMDWVCP
jgi:hypothetical protein